MSPDAALSSDDALTGGQSLAWALPSAALSGPFFLAQFYLLNFATDVLLISPALVGLWITVGRIWDAISDPLVGRLSDRSRMRFGRRRPWLLGGAIGVGLSFALLWSPPGALEGAALATWVGVALLLFMSTTTAWAIPHLAWGSELGGTPDARVKLFGIRQACSMLGVASAFGAMQYVVNADIPRDAAAGLGAIGGLVVAALLLVPVFTLREGRPAGVRTHGSVVHALRGIFTSARGRLLFGARLATLVGTGVIGAVAPYMAIYLLERPDLVGILPAAYIGPMILSIPLWVVVARRFGRVRSWCLSMLAAAVGYAGLFWAEAEALPLVLGLVGFIGLVSGSAGPIGPSLLADLIDADEATSGERKDGVFFAAWEFAEKAGSAIVVIIVALALEVSGFQPNAVQSAPAEAAIRACASFFPAVMLLVASGLLWRLGDPPPSG